MVRRAAVPTTRRSRPATLRLTLRAQSRSHTSACESPETVIEEKVDTGYRAPKEFELHINLNLGTARAVMCAADLTEYYVDFNQGNVTITTKLGG